MNRRNSRVGIFMLSISLLISCGVTTQDKGLGNNGSVSGRAVDSYIARAVVFVDTNENAVLEAWEQRAFTDAEGYFSYNPKTKVNYCADTTKKSGQIHCLVFPAGVDEALIRLVSGYDITTGEKFKGMMTLRVEANTDITIVNTGSPLTSLLAELDAEHQQALAEAEGFSIAQLADEFLADFSELEASEGTRRQLTAAALQAHKIADVIAHFIEASMSEKIFGEKESLPEDATFYVYQAMAALIANQLDAKTLTNLNAFFATPDNLEKIITATGSKVREKINTDVTLVLSSTTGVATRITEFAKFIQNLFEPIVNSGELNDSQDLQARLRAVEVVTALLRLQENVTANETTPAVADAMALATKGDAVTYLNTLSDAKVDILDMVSTFSTNAENNATTSVADIDFSDRQSLQEQLGISTSLKDSTEPVTLNLVKNNSTNDTFGFTFKSDGTLSAAVDVSATDNAESALKTDEPLPGTWEQINDYTMLINVEVGGVIKPVIMKTDPNDPNGGYKFDYGGEIQSWQGSTGG